MRSILFFITSLLAFSSAPLWAQENGGTVYLIRPKASTFQPAKVYINDVLAALVLDNETLVMNFEHDGRIAIQRSLHHEVAPLIINVRRGQSYFVELRLNTPAARLLQSIDGASLMKQNDKVMHMTAEQIQRIPLLPIP